MSLTFEQARQIALVHLAEMTALGADEYVLIEERTRERSFGWVFSYDTRRHMESGRFGDLILGIRPFIVDAQTGEVHITSIPVEESLDRYEKTGKCD